MKKIIVTIVALLCISAYSCNSADVSVHSEESKAYTYLVAGLDDAAENTDVLFLLSYTPRSNAVSVLQIPRDTLAEYKGSFGKINRIVPMLLAGGASRSDAMRELKLYLEENLGVSVDGFITLDTDTFRRAVDLIGGVDIISDRDITVTDEKGTALFSIKRGDVLHLDGNMAEAFVRYRKGYSTGDLGRIDAQKLFLRALFQKVKGSLGVDEAIRLSALLIREVDTDVSPLTVIKLLRESRENIGDMTVSFATLPGEAISIDNTSFYVINRKNAAEILKTHFGATKIFDPKRVFVSEENDAARNVYYDENADYKIFEG